VFQTDSAHRKNPRNSVFQASLSCWCHQSRDAISLWLEN